MRSFYTLEHGLKVLWALLSCLAFFVIISMSLMYVILPYYRIITVKDDYFKEFSTNLILFVFLFHVPIILLSLSTLFVFTREAFLGYQQPSKIKIIGSLSMYGAGLVCLFLSKGYLFYSFFSNISFTKDYIAFIFIAVMVVASYIGIIANRVTELVRK